MFPMRRDVANRGSVAGFLHRMVLLVAVAGTALAAGPAVAEASDDSAAQRLVQQVTSAIVDELIARRDALGQDPQAVYELVDRLVLPHFDFERMSRRVIGKKHWNAATAVQRTRFVAAFRVLLVRTYALLLNEYRGQRFTWLDPAPRERDDVIVVPVMIDTAGSRPVRVAYTMHGGATDWKVFDVAVEGVSLARNYRSSFRAELARHGIDGLNASLEAKNAAMN